jgi:hypothetical protein
MDNSSKYASVMEQLFRIAELHQVKLTDIEFSNATRGSYYAANDGSWALVWRICELIQAKLPDGSWVQFDMDGKADITAMNLAAWTGQAWYNPPPPPPPDPSVADPSPLKSIDGNAIGDPIANQPGRFNLKVALPEGQKHSEGGKTYIIVAEKTMFGGKTFVAELVA